MSVMYPYHFNTPHPHPMSFPSLLSHFVCGLCTPITLSSPTLALFLGVSLLLTFYSITLCMWVVYPHHFIIPYPHPSFGCQSAPNHLLSCHTLYVSCVPHHFIIPYPHPISGCQSASNLLFYHTLYVCCVPPSLYHHLPSPYFWVSACS